MTGQERVAFRPMEPEDRSAVLALSRAWAEENITYGYAPDGEKELEDYRCWVAEVGGRVVSYAAGQVDKGNVCTGLLFQLNSQLKQNLCQHRIIFVGYRIACEECVHTVVLRTFFLQDLVCLKHLLGGHAVFCISRIIHNSVTCFKNSTRIISATYSFRNACFFFHEINHCNIIKINNSTKLCAVSKFTFRCFI